MAVETIMVAGGKAALATFANFVGDVMLNSQGFLPVFNRANQTATRVFVRNLSHGDTVTRVPWASDKIKGGDYVLATHVTDVLGRASPFFKLETREAHSWWELFRVYERVYVAPFSVVDTIYKNVSNGQPAVSKTDKDILAKLHEATWTRLTINQQEYIIPLLEEEVLYQVMPVWRKAAVQLAIACSFVFNYVLLNRVPVTKWMRERHGVTCGRLTPMQGCSPALWQ